MAEQKPLMDGIFNGPDSVMGRIFEGPDSVMGRIFGSDDEFALEAPAAVRIRLNSAKMMRLASGEQLEFQANGQTILLVYE
jgi:hypothetical protein